MEEEEGEISPCFWMFFGPGGTSWNDRGFSLVVFDSAGVWKLLDGQDLFTNGWVRSLNTPFPFVQNGQSLDVGIFDAWISQSLLWAVMKQPENNWERYVLVIYPYETAWFTCTASWWEIFDGTVFHRTNGLWDDMCWLGCIKAILIHQIIANQYLHTWDAINKFEMYFGVVIWWISNNLVNKFCKYLLLGWRIQQIWQVCTEHWCTGSHLALSVVCRILSEHRRSYWHRNHYKKVWICRLPRSP